jgi:pimeloyl-ACP methyl ester carboxylesterase
MSREKGPRRWRAAGPYATFPKDRAVISSDNTRIAYTILDGGKHLPVVFINGWSCADGYWARIAPAVVEAGHPAVLLDARGHGQSGLPRAPGWAARGLRPEDVSADRMARDVIEVLDDAGIDRAVLCGHSMGVQLMVEACRVAPERAAGLIPIAGTFENPVRTFADLRVLDHLYPLGEVVFRYTPFEILRPVIKRTATPSLGRRVIRTIRVGGEKVQAADIAGHMSHLGYVNFSVLMKMMSALRAHETAEFLPHIAVPTLVLAGRRDLFTPPKVQQRMADLIPDSEIVWFDEGGHLLPVEEPEGVLAAILDFLRRRFDDTSATQLTPPDGDARPTAGDPIDSPL